LNVFKVFASLIVRTVDKAEAITCVKVHAKRHTGYLLWNRSITNGERKEGAALYV